jgi:hypothetical protein
LEGDFTSQERTPKKTYEAQPDDWKLALFFRITQEDNRKPARETSAQKPSNHKSINSLRAPETKNGFVYANNFSVAPGLAPPP